jgi:hypothetical protein
VQKLAIGRRASFSRTRSSRELKALTTHAEEMSERHDLGKNFSGKDQSSVAPNHFISQVYDLLARHLPVSDSNSTAQGFKLDTQGMAD